MKKTLFFALTLLFATQMVLADGAIDVKMDNFGKCDEQYYSVIKLKIKRPEAIPFSINKQGGKVEFSTGNLQYCAAQRLFRFAPRQWDFVGDKLNDYSSNVLWDSLVITFPDPVGDPTRADTTHNWVPSRNDYAGKKYAGWIDLFGWGTSGYQLKNDSFAVCTKPYSTSNSLVPAGVARNANPYGYGPSVLTTPIYTNKACIDTLDPKARMYDWGQFNDIYCVWVGYDTTKAEGNTGKDTILFDSTVFKKGTWRTLRDSEWKYMLFTRKVENKKSAAYALGGILRATTADFSLFGGGSDPRGFDAMDTVKGLFIFPDNFEISEAYKVGFNPDERAQIVYGENLFGKKAISYQSFMALEKLGVVFLPVACSRTAPATFNRQTLLYWSASCGATKGVTGTAVNLPENKYGSATALRFLTNATVTEDVALSTAYSPKYIGASVRLVRDLNTKLEKPVSAFQ